ncbi:MAG TPA: hypothetical protein VFP71_10200, partial [Candidatus Angelobacter sp.]|nr:hypothetical protein [Candidatus Angelobacter sp.]
MGNSVSIGFQALPTVVANASSPGFNTGLSFNGSPIYVQTYSVLTSDGSLHQLVTTNGGKAAMDGSGYAVAGNYLLDRNGAKISSVAEDANGNLLSTTVDTVGRNIPPMPGPAAPNATPPASTASLSQCPALNYNFQPVIAAYVWNLPSPNSGSLPLILCYASVYVRSNVFSGADPTHFHEISKSFTMLQSVVYPDTTYWAFQYDAADPNNTSSFALADLLKVSVPTGGSIAYTWDNKSGATAMVRAVQTRSLDANNGAGPQVWHYSYGSLTLVNGNVTQNTIVQDPLGNETVHVMTGLGGGQELFETQSQYFQGSHTGGTLLKTVNTDYQFFPNQWDSSSISGAPPDSVTGVSPIRVTTIWPSGLTSKVETDYDTALAYHGPLDGITWNVLSCPFDYGCSYIDLTTNPVTNYTASYGKALAEREYAYGQGAAGPLLRQTQTVYQWQANGSYLTNNFLDLVSSSTVRDGAGNQVASTTYGYDEYGLGASHVAFAYLNPNPVNGLIRGNQTSVHHWLNTTNGTVTSTAQYFDSGEVQSSTDPGQHTTTHLCDLAYQGALSTQTCLPTTGGVTHCVNGAYDVNTGLLTSFTDQNGLTSNFAY